TRVSMACAALAAEWAGKDVHGWNAATSSMMTSTPRLSRSAGAAAWARKNVPFAVTSNASSQSSSVTSSSAVGSNPAPAACTTRASPPRPGTPAAPRPSGPSGGRGSAPRRPAATTCHPSARRRSTIAEPTRPVPPATSARLSERRKVMLDRSKTGRATAFDRATEGNNRPMRTLAVTLAAVGALVAPGLANAATKGVNLYGWGVSPATVTVTQGDTVLWTNRDNANHQVLASKGEFVSTILHRGNQFSFTFNAAGTYRYSDELHPKLTGTVVVKGLPPSLTLGASAPITTAGDQ